LDITVVILTVVACAVALKLFLYRRRKRYLTEKYGDPAVVAKLMQRMFWIGQTEGQLIDSLGRPVEIDRKAMKTRTREVWKYNRRTRTQFGLRITLDNGIVITWDQKA
jgi:hypothetical protein